MPAKVAGLELVIQTMHKCMAALRYLVVVSRRVPVYRAGTYRKHTQVHRNKTPSVSYRHAVQQQSNSSSSSTQAE